MGSFLKLLLCLSLVGSGLIRAAAAEPATLKCGATSIGPFLDFEFRFVAGTWFSLPLKQFWGGHIKLDFAMQVEPIRGTPGKPFGIRHELNGEARVPDGIRGEISFPSAVSVGLGQYRTQWLIRDSYGRSCAGAKNFKVSLARKERSVEVTLGPGEIVDTGMYVFRPQEAVDRPPLNRPRRLKVFISMDVVGRRGRVVRTRMFHVIPYFAALRRLASSPSFNEFSVVVFSFEDQKVVARHGYQETVDFQSLRSVIGDLQPETVDFSELARGSELKFFESLLAEELLMSEPPEALVFLGQDLHYGKQLAAELLNRFRDLGTIVSFWDSSRYAWRGAMGNFVRAMGGKERAVRRPSDLAQALAGFEARVLESRPQ